ncbi:cation-transporting ATPase [Streptomyces sp. WAC 05977]|nr:cation-transporting ATPase [Streptomyces sp. WAC 05977]
MSARTYAVRGMACGFVSEEIETISGVTAVDVENGTVTVTSDDVRAAVEEAGYELTGT